MTIRRVVACADGHVMTVSPKPTSEINSKGFRLAPGNRWHRVRSPLIFSSETKMGRHRRFETTVLNPPPDIPVFALVLNVTREIAPKTRYSMGSTERAVL